MNNWYSITNNAETAEISIFDEIGDFGTSARDFIEEIISIGKKDITLRINSVGGSVFDGLAIYNALRSHNGVVTVRIEGLAASISTVIAMGGDKIEMAENGFFMIHNPFGQSAGEATDFRKTADLLDKIKDEIIEIYQRKTKMPYDVLSEMMDKETWLTSEEAEQFGFIDYVIEPMKVAAKFNFSKFTNVNEKEVMDVLNLNNNKKLFKMTEELKTWFNSLKEEIVMAVKGDDALTPEGEVSGGLSDNQEVSDKLTELCEDLAAAESEKEELANLVGEKESTILDLQNKVSELETKINKNEATETVVETEEEPTITKTEETNDEWTTFAKKLVNKL